MPRLTCVAGWLDQLGASVCVACATVCGSEVNGDGVCCAVSVIVCVALSGSIYGGSVGICAVSMIVSVVREDICGVGASVRAISVCVSVMCCSGVVDVDVCVTGLYVCGT